jgi:hypothetical protein
VISGYWHREGLIVAGVEAAELYFHAHEFFDATVQLKPIYISPNEVYAMHSLLAQHMKILVSIISPAQSQAAYPKSAGRTP